ncbi:MAG: DNA internalization-related competence protein ComEC/Rec2 [Turicibacter sp.]|nr:DNA internalization-related competence protein ComEC/Rec2 [Turicibacter sp.]
MNFKFRQHVIYIVLSIIVVLLIKEGVFILFFVGFVYFKRFPKTYWIYYLIAIGAVIYLQISLYAVDVKGDLPLFIDQAKVVEVKNQTEGKQTAKIHTASGDYYLTLASETPKLMPGLWIDIQTEASEVSAPTVPHAFSFKDYVQSQGMRGSVYLTKTHIIREEWSVRSYQFKGVDWVKANYPPLTATYLQAWFLGIRQDLSGEVSDSYSTLGIIHLFAVSGLHVGLLVGMVSYVFKRLGMIQELADGLVILLLLGFMVLTGMSSSIVRATSMFILAKLNTRFKWCFSSLDIFSIVFLINFLICPRQVYQIGFIYSYWLTFCLILCQSFIKNVSVKLSFFIVPFLAQLAVLPIQMSQDYSVNLLSYFSNLILIPLVTTLLIPLLLLTLCFPPLALVTEEVLVLFEKIILGMGRLLHVRWVVGSISITMVIMIIVLLGVVGWLLEKNRRSKKWLIIGLSIVLFLEFIRMFQPASQITFLDVGQGDSTIIQSPYQECVTVVDTGGNVSFTDERTSIFSQTLEPYLLGEGVRKIDYLILSHGDFDHIGEATQLLEAFDVKHLVISKESESQELKKVIQLAKTLGTQVLVPKQNDTIICQNQTITFLQPDTKQASENDQSLVTLIEIDQLRLLLTGDISATVEEKVLADYPDLKADIYKAAHHGSKTSNSEAFLKQISPMISVISSGKNNLYHHPSQEFIETLDLLKIPSLNTQNDGTIQFEIKKSEILLHLFH